MPQDHDVRPTPHHAADQLPPAAHVHIEALQDLLGIRIVRGSFTVNFDQGVARSLKVDLHRHLASSAKKG